MKTHLIQAAGQAKQDSQHRGQSQPGWFQRNRQSLRRPWVTNHPKQTDKNTFEYIKNPPQLPHPATVAGIGRSHGGESSWRLRSWMKPTDGRNGRHRADRENDLRQER